MNIVLSIVFGVLSFFVSPASAEISCEAVKRSAGVQVIRGIRIKHPAAKFEETTWFGTDSTTRDRAARACSEVVNSTSCTATAPHAADRYMNVGDPGFGPRLLVEKSTRAGILSLQWVPEEVLRYYPSDYSNLQGKYFAFYSGCEEARSELAHDVVKRHQTEFLNLAREKFIRENPSAFETDWRYVP